MPRQRGSSRRTTKGKKKSGARIRRGARHFVGREASPVLDRYPPKDPSLSLRPLSPAPSRTPPPPTPTAAATTPGSPGPTGPTAPSSSAPSSTPLITLDRPFDVDEFAAMLGETSIQVTVPREALPEVLRRVMEFMGFGIYVYAVTVRPAPSELLKSFVVELQRVDYSPEKGTWTAFVDRGAGGTQ